MKRPILRAVLKSYLAESQMSFQKKSALFMVIAMSVFFCCPVFSQVKKEKKLPSQGSLSTKPLDTQTKAKKFEELSDFVIVDYRSGAVAGVVEPEGEETSLKKDLESMFPVHTVFATSDPQVCVIGVQSTADAKTVFSKTSPKKSRIAKRDNIGKMLAEKNVKLITKEK
jgi:hypothetical protein